MLSLVLQAGSPHVIFFMCVVKDVCWRGIDNSYNCSLIMLESPYNDDTEFHLEIGRLYRLQPELDANCKYYVHEQ